MDIQIHKIQIQIPSLQNRLLDVNGSKPCSIQPIPITIRSKTLIYLNIPKRT